jgi:hypothetical protein
MDHIFVNDSMGEKIKTILLAQMLMNVVNQIFAALTQNVSTKMVHMLVNVYLDGKIWTSLIVKI